MSTNKPATRAEHKEYCLRRLGKPVIQVNVEDTQLEDCIDEALFKFQYHHHDGSEHVYIPLQITDQVRAQGYWDVDPSIIGIYEMLETSYTISQFTVDYQLMANAVPFSLVGQGLLTYQMSLRYREDFKFVTTGKKKIIRYSRHMNRLYIDTDMNYIYPTTLLFVHAQKILDPNQFTGIWNDPWLKRYTTALVKRQWGNNLRKLKNITLVGGVALDAQGILDEAHAEIEEMENEILDNQEPLPFFIG